ncbi:MAG: M23 family metallopeptidase [Candidatus Melainabacteria bacterium]|nr:M23 family metallopeptidase [Candidatus Melainabacteria bacterium]
MAVTDSPISIPMLVSRWRRLAHSSLLPSLLAGLLCFLGFAVTVWADTYGNAPTHGKMTSPFGWRTHPVTQKHQFHAGIDIAASTGDPIYVTQDGTVVFSGPYKGYGNVMVVQHAPNLFTLYGHCSQNLVQPGQWVARGQVIGLVGSTGLSTGPHLHFEVHQNRQYVNPLAYLGWLNQVFPTQTASKP